jgi:magnesium chelatase family protein
MSLARAHGVVIAGVEAHVVEIEAHLSSGLPGMGIVGLADTAVGEARDRVRAAILNSGARWPQARITVGLSPASLHKRGSGLDLGIASAILAADGQIPPESLAGCVLFAELGLDGRVRSVPGAVMAAVAARQTGRSRVVVADASAEQAAIVPGIDAVGVFSLRHWGALLTGQDPTPFELPFEDAEPASPVVRSPADLDLAEVRGQDEAVAALEVAAVGGHHVSMVGRPGVGKTLLAERLPTILPDLTDDEALTVTAIHSVVGRVDGLVRRPPFQAPHHTASVAALVGGGRGGQPSPGAVTLSHHGVLFLDECAELSSPCLEALRQPLESGEVIIARSGFSSTLPARFQLVLAANPCPCGMGDGDGARCTCRSQDRRRYLSRLSGPLMDRVDIRLWVGRPAVEQWGAESAVGGLDSASVRSRVVQARARTRHRAERLGNRAHLTGQYRGSELRGCYAPDALGVDALSTAIRSGRLSARGADRVLRVAWSLADLSGAERPGLEHIGRALSLRSGGIDAS